MRFRVSYPSDSTGSGRYIRHNLARRLDTGCSGHVGPYERPLRPKPKGESKAKKELPKNFAASFWLLIDHFLVSFEGPIIAATATLGRKAVCPYFTIEYCDGEGLCKDSDPCPPTGKI